MTPLALPAPTPAEAAHGARVVAHVQDTIAREGGWIPFSRYVELVLYAPGLGYYSAGARKLGAEGDFVTAPEISPVYGRCIATQCAEVLRDLDGGELLELGAGTGALACEVLESLARDGVLPARYRILEVSADLRDRQRERVAALPPTLRGRVEWLDAPPEHAWCGVLLANEVLDALPFDRFRRTGTGSEELGVENATGAEPFRWSARPARAELATAVAAIESDLGAALPPGHVGEVCLALEPWLAAVTGSLRAGLALFVDYGLPRRALYDAGHAHGTLACHYRHRRHDDPFRLPGLQDVTAWVDFTRVAEAAVAAGFEIAGYTPQAHFLLGTGFDRHVGELRESLDERARALHGGGGGDGALAAHRAAQLVLPGELGERFKCIGLARGLSGTPSGFRLRDLTATL